MLVARCAVRLATVTRRRRPSRPLRRIAAVWYYPPEMPGSNLRLGRWKPFFERDGYVWDNFAVASFQTFVDDFERGSWSRKYLFYLRVLAARLRQFFRIARYDVVWVDRGFLPFYPLRDAFFERALKRVVPRLVVDSSDGSDYQGNAPLVLDTIAQADTLTVACKALHDFYVDRHPDVRWFNWAIPVERYKPRMHYRVKDRPVLGWMGSPQVFAFVKALERELALVAREVPFVLRIICRTPMAIDVPGADVEFHPFDDATYFDLLQSFDVGLCPFLVDDFASRGKVAMKHQELMVCGVPQVCSPIAICEETVDGENALIARRPGDWAPAILRLFRDEALRERIGRASRATFLRLYTYEGEYPKIKDALLRPS